MKVCAEPGCAELTRDSRCDTHGKARRRQADKRRPSARQRGYTSRWQRFAKTYLRDHPLCEDPEGCGQHATDVDHLDGQGPNGPRGFDTTNLKALCHSHHSRRTATDQPGGFNAR